MRTANLIPWLLALCTAGHALGQITYQGDLKDDDQPADGVYDIRFDLYDASENGNVIGTNCVNNVLVTQGRFTAVLNYGAAFDGSPRYIEISLRPDTGLPCSDPSGLVPLAGRQRLTFTPMALFAQDAQNALSAANATQLNGQAASFYTNATNLSSGTIPSARLTGFYGSALTFSNSGNVFIGSGGGLTGLNASNLSLGTVPDSRLPSNLLRTNAASSSLSGSLLVSSTTGTLVTPSAQFQVGPIGAPSSAAAFLRITDGTALLGFRPTDPAGFANVSVRVYDTDPDGSLVFQVGSTNEPDMVSSYYPHFSVRDNGEISLGSGADSGLLGIGLISSTAYPHINLKQAGGSGFARLGFSHTQTDRTWVVAARVSDADIATDRLNFFHNGGAAVGSGDILSLSGGSGAGSGRVGINTVNPLASLHIVGNLHLEGAAGDISAPSNETLQLGHLSGSTFTPRLTLNTSGNAVFSGAVSAETETRWAGITAADLQPLFRCDHSTAVPAYLFQSGGAGAIASASIALPHGAIITSIRAAIIDSSPDTEIFVQLRRTSFLSASSTTLATAQSTGIAPSLQMIQTSTISSAVVNAEDYLYEISVSIPSAVVTGDVRFYRVQVIYTTPASLR